ncbi:MAG: hypothetical protein ACKOQ8_05940 [Micrococcales bacterium]
MTTATKQQKLEDIAHATDILNSVADSVKSGNALLLVSVEYGKGLTDYLRASIVTTRENGEITNSQLTWAIAKKFGYSLRDRNGYYYLAISGYGYSKADEIARDLAKFFGVSRIRYEQN